MTRAATWILGSISGLLLALLVILSPATMIGGYGTGGSCVSSNGGPCTPTIDQVTVTLPQLNGPAAAAMALAILAILIGLPAWIATPILALRRGSSARTAILIVAVIASAILLVSVLLLTTSSSEVLSAPQVCLSGSNSFQAQTCYTGDQAYWVALVGIAWGPISLALLLGAPAWVMTLTQTARLRQWGWFVFALFLSPIAALLYAFFGSGKPASAAPITPTPAPALS